MTTITARKATPVAVVPAARYNTSAKPKSIYYDITLRITEGDEEKGVLAVPMGVQPPQVGKPIYYLSEIVKSKSGGEDINKIEWPVAPHLRPAPTQEEQEAAQKEAMKATEITEPLKSPVEEARGTPAPEPPKPQIPDSQPRMGVIKSITKIDKDTFTPKDGQPQYKYQVVMTDGAQGVMWSPEQEPPAKVDQELNYTYDKIYQDGSKRIAMAPIGAAVDKETTIVRLACMKASVEYHASLPEKPENPGMAMRLMAEQWEAWVMRNAE